MRPPINSILFNEGFKVSAAVFYQPANFYIRERVAFVAFPYGECVVGDAKKPCGFLTA